MIYRINKFFLDTNNFTLTQANDVVHVEPQVFNVIVYLIEHKERVVTRDELLETIWKGKVVSDSSISNYIKSARKVLDDDGVKQNVIKTIHGRGYQFVAPFELVDSDETDIETKNTNPRIKIFVLSASVLLLILTYVFIQKAAIRKAVQNIADYQEISYATFVAQAKRRNELVKMIEERLGETRKMQFEKFFSYYFDDMNDAERFVFDQIRGMTNVGLYQNNTKILVELNEHPEIFDLIEGTKALEQHLIFWVNKYHSVFVQREDMCLLYVGVEDGVPYPQEVNQNIIEWLAK